MTIKTHGTQKEAQVLVANQKPSHLLHYDMEYDTMSPEETIRGFVDNVRGMIKRYEGNRERIGEIESELLDIEHYMEIGKFKNVPEGYKLYRRLAELRRERRACKNENDLLWPIYEHFHGTEVLNKLSRVQGECSKVREAIDGRVYAIRTDILDDWFEEEKAGQKEAAGISTEMFFGQDLMLEENPDVGEDEPKYRLAWRADEANRKGAVKCAQA